MTNEKIQPPIKNTIVTDLVREIDEVRGYPDKLWDKTVNVVKDYYKNNPEYNSPSLEEIITFGEEILNTKASDRYSLTLKKNSDGNLWYDILMGNDNQKIFFPVEDFLKEKYEKTHHKWKLAADIGSGTGNTLRSIAPFCDKVWGIDSSEAAINTAKEIGVPENTKLLLCSAEKLIFFDQSLDLVVSNGLIYYLSSSQTTNFINELSRVLKHGGKFYQSYYYQESGKRVPKVCNDPTKDGKSALIFLLDKIVTGGGNPESLSVLEVDVLLTLKDFFKTNVKNYPDRGVLVEYTKA